MRGTFANIRLRNQLAPGTEGGLTVWDGEQTTIYEAAMAAAEQGVPLCVLAGEEYGSGSSRDWAAKGPSLLGIRFVLARSYERIHRSNLVGMGVLPLQFPDGESAESLGLTGTETFDLAPLQDGATTLQVTTSTGVAFDARVRIDTPNEWLYFRHGGILHFVLRQLRAQTVTAHGRVRPLGVKHVALEVDGVHATLEWWSRFPRGRDARPAAADGVDRSLAIS